MDCVAIVLADGVKARIKARPDFVRLHNGNIRGKERIEPIGKCAYRDLRIGTEGCDHPARMDTGIGAP